MPRERKILVIAALLVIPILSSAMIYVAFALTPPPPSIDIILHFDLDTARGFNKIEPLSSQDIGTPKLILEQGRTGTLNITFTAYKEPFAVMKENDTAQILDIRYGGTPPYNHGWTPGENSLPPGITASIAAPQNMTLPPGSNVTVTLQISATPDAAIGVYYLTFSVEEKTPTMGGTAGYSTVLKVVEKGTAPPTTTTTTTTTVNTTKITTTSYVTRTVTTGLTQTITSTSTSTLPATLTSTTTATTTIIGQATDSSTYAWAISATVAAMVLAVIIFLRKTK